MDDDNVPHEMPVPCASCGRIMELTDCIFPDPDDNTYGICDICYEQMTGAE